MEIDVSTNMAAGRRARGTGDGHDPGVLRIDFPGGTGEEQLEPISWEAWFEKFDEAGLAFLYREHQPMVLGLLAAPGLRC